MGNCCSPGCRLWCLWWCLFCAVLFPTMCLGWGLELNWVSFWGFFFLLSQNEELLMINGLISEKIKKYFSAMGGRTAPRSAAMDTFRWGTGGTSIGEWEHNNNIFLRKKSEKWPSLQKYVIWSECTIMLRSECTIMHLAGRRPSNYFSNSP